MRRFLFKYKKDLIITLFLVMLVALMNVFLAFILKMFFDTAIKGDLERFYNVYEIAIIFLIFTSMIIWLARASRFSYIKKTLVYLKNTLFDNILRKDLSEFDEENTGKYISIISNDIKIVEQDYFHNFFQLVQSGFISILSLVAVFALDYKITFILIALIVLCILVPRILDREISKLREIFSHSLEEYTIETKNILSGLEIVKSFGVEKKDGREI
ncbi:MAG: ABC transporter transmembrane domain-containing protein [Thermoanaerobacteraceae bacterium]